MKGKLWRRKTKGGGYVVSTTYGETLLHGDKEKGQEDVGKKQEWSEENWRENEGRRRA